MPPTRWAERQSRRRQGRRRCRRGGGGWEWPWLGVGNDVQRRIRRHEVDSHERRQPSFGWTHILRLDPSRPIVAANDGVEKRTKAKRQFLIASLFFAISYAVVLASANWISRVAVAAATCAAVSIGTLAIDRNPRLSRGDGQTSTHPTPHGRETLWARGQVGRRQSYRVS